MKKVVILSAMALLGGSVVFTSCSKKKDWQCVCNVTGGGQTVSGGGPIMDAKKGDAEKACQSMEDQANAAGQGQITADCTLTEK